MTLTEASRTAGSFCLSPDRDLHFQRESKLRYVEYEMSSIIDIDFSASVGRGSVPNGSAASGSVSSGPVSGAAIPNAAVAAAERADQALVDILDYDRAGLQDLLVREHGLQSFRARQLVQWLYKRRVRSFDGMTDISKTVREHLAATFRIFRPELVKRLDSVDGSRKYLFKMSDGSMVESVLIRQPKRYTLCISSQVGCAIGCKFCRTGLMGLTRHLRTCEIIGQVLAVQDDIAERTGIQPEDALPAGSAESPNEQFENIVFMGMGEPLHNFDNVVKTVRLLNDELGLNFSSRKITVSTSGLVPAIEQLGTLDVPANLAISLNATTDETRTQLIPINKRWPLDALLGALRNYPLRSRKRITIEYVMLRGINDSDADLARLPRLLEGIPSKINLIPYNANTGLALDGVALEPPANETIHRWQKALLAKGHNATIRWSKGQDIQAACGQLATESARRKSAA